MRQTWIAILGLAVIVGALVYAFQSSIFEVPKPDIFLSYDETTVSLGTISYRAWIADTEAKRIKGLGDIIELKQDQAMVFVFPTQGYWGIHMKDMYFPIDILWLDQDFTVVDLKENVSPKTFPEVFEPRTPAQYVIEFNAGALSKGNVGLGSTLPISF